MALTEIQLPTKQLLYDNLQEAATQMNRLMGDWRDLAEFIGNIDTADLDILAVPAGQERTDLVNFRTAINEFLAFYDGTAQTQTVIPGNVVDLIRRMR
jgi:hypothetical protein